MSAGWLEELNNKLEVQLSSIWLLDFDLWVWEKQQDFSLAVFTYSISIYPKRPDFPLSF